MGNRRIGFVSTRIQGTDGVSLEAKKWASVFEELGHKCFWCAGLLDTPEENSWLFEPMFFNTEENLALNRELFGSSSRSRHATDRLWRHKEMIKDQLYEYIGHFSLDILVVQNALAIPMQIPLAMALTEVIAETEIPVIGHHHDMWWERPRFLVNSIPDILQSSFPPDLPSMRHVVINSMIQKELAARRGITSYLIPNVLDFSLQNPEVDDYNHTFRDEFGFTEEDILILQPTRVVSRKGIEQAIYLVKRLDLPRVKLLISHSSDDEGSEYQDWIQETANHENIEIYFLYNRLNETRAIDSDGRRLYTLWDVYPHVDLITYPSLYEGFGNAFLEAVFFRKPILVNRYSVFIVDIEPKGFQTITMDGFLTERTIKEVRSVLTDGERRKRMSEANYKLGKSYYSFDVLADSLQGILASIYGRGM